MTKKIVNIVKLAIGRLTLKKLKNNQVRWIEAVNGGLMHPGNYYLFDYAIKNIDSNYPIMEIGSFCGLSSNILLYLLKRHHKRNLLIACDPWEALGGWKRVSDRKGILKGTDINLNSYLDFCLETYKRNVIYFSKKNLPYAIRTTSDKFFDSWSNNAVVEDIFGRRIRLDGLLSFCFIDGDHRYFQVKRDFIKVDRILAKKGFLMFDDSADGSNRDVSRLMDEIKKLKRYKLILKNPNYLFQKTS